MRKTDPFKDPPVLSFHLNSKRSSDFKGFAKVVARVFVDWVDEVNKGSLTNQLEKVLTSEDFICRPFLEAQRPIDKVYRKKLLVRHFVRQNFICLTLTLKDAEGAVTFYPSPKSETVFVRPLTPVAELLYSKLFAELEAKGFGLRNLNPAGLDDKSREFLSQSSSFYF